MDSPRVPDPIIIALLKNPSGASLMNVNNMTLKSFYLALELEGSSQRMEDGISDEHISELYAKCQMNDEISKHSPTNGSGSSNDGGDGEKYEEQVPYHEDLMAYNFYKILKRNPKQIIR